MRQVVETTEQSWLDEVFLNGALGSTQGRGPATWIELGRWAILSPCSPAPAQPDFTALGVGLCGCSVAGKPTG